MTTTPKKNLLTLLSNLRVVDVRLIPLDAQDEQEGIPDSYEVCVESMDNADLLSAVFCIPGEVLDNYELPDWDGKITYPEPTN